jgi:hypothetical protein
MANDLSASTDAEPRGKGGAMSKKGPSPMRRVLTEEWERMARGLALRIAPDVVDAFRLIFFSGAATAMAALEEHEGDEADLADLVASMKIETLEAASAPLTGPPAGEDGLR